MAAGYKHLTEDEKCRIVQMHLDGKSTRRISIAMKRSFDTIQRLLIERCGYGEWVEAEEMEGELAVPPPTPEEIAERCAEIQGEWSHYERRWGRLAIKPQFVNVGGGPTTELHGESMHEFIEWVFGGQREAC